METIQNTEGTVKPLTSETAPEKAKSPVRLLKIINIVFPAVTIAALALQINYFNNKDYAVTVEYGGKNIGVVSDENVLNDAQITLSDRIKYYDTGDSFSMNASIKLEPLALGTEVMDVDSLADSMEDIISEQYDEALPDEHTEEETEEDNSGKVKAYAIRVDGEFLGAVVDYEPIETAIQSYKTAYNNNDYLKVDFEKKVVYDLEEYVDPEDIVSHADILKTILGRVGTTDYYEVKDGDWLTKIADEKHMTLDELCKCRATYEGKPVELGGDLLKTGTLIQISATKPYLQLECTKEEIYRTKLQYNTKVIKDPLLPEDESIVEVEGVNGERRARVMVTYRNDIPVRKKTIETTIYSRPVTQVVRVGTAPMINKNVPKFKFDVGTGDYCWPGEGGYISAHVGDGRNHKGLDIAAPFGTPIYAAEAGTVYDVGEGWSGGYGNNIKIQNDDGNICVYAHQSETYAQLGDHVEKGELIGFVGSTGDSTGNHLHFEVRGDGVFYDPEEFVSQ